LNIKIPTISEIVVENLRKEIVKGKLRPDAKLNIDSLARKFNISKTPIRESLKKLESEGLLVFVPRSGWKVSRLSKKEFLDLCEIQEILEVNLSIKIIKYIDLINFTELEKINCEIDNYIKDGKYDLIFDANQTFHTKIYEVYPNSQILKFLNQIWNKINRQRHLMLTSRKFLTTIVKEHEEIIQALQEKNVNKLETCMHQHFRTGIMAISEDFDDK